MSKGHAYALTFVTEHLAVGHAPMSHDQLESLRRQGVTAILNLCAEFCDLHDIEAAAGFEVYYLPIPDEEAPDLPALEKALAWLDEAVYLGKKVLIHCRHGIGRTGTVLNAYLLRRGLGHRQAARILRPLRSKPTNFDQWWTVRKYGRASGQLTIREPTLESRHLVDLGPFLRDLDNLANSVEERFAPGQERCGLAHDRCCRAPVSLSFIETVALAHGLNVALKSEVRLAVIERAGAVSRALRETQARQAGSPAYCLSDAGVVCPLSEAGACLLFTRRPLQCRTFDLDGPAKAGIWDTVLEPALRRLSEEVFLAYVGSFSGVRPPRFHLPDVVSGHFVARFFKVLSSRVDPDPTNGL